MSRPSVLVFDSGVGGLSVLESIVESGLDCTLDYAADTLWLPYGEKPEAALRQRVADLLAGLAAELAPDLVVLACNTASTIALDAARARLSVPVVGVVPPIKPAAAASRSGVIGLLATPATVRRAYVDDLVAAHAAELEVVRVGSTALVAAAEAKLSGIAPDPTMIAAAIEPLFANPRLDVVALACTHFPLLGAELVAAAPRPVLWLDSGEAIARRVATLLALTAGGGCCRLRRALFTAPEIGLRQIPAFAARGFSSFGAIDRGFSISPLQTGGLG
jgi:glutamate racemase